MHRINYFHIPGAWDAPHLEELSTFFAIMDVLKGRKSWVHCAKNMRVSAFVYLYRRLRLGEAEEPALVTMHAIWTPNEIWQNFIDAALLQSLA